MQYAYIRNTGGLEIQGRLRNLYNSKFIVFGGAKRRVTLAGFNSRPNPEGSEGMGQARPPYGVQSTRDTMLRMRIDTRCPWPLCGYLYCVKTVKTVIWVVFVRGLRLDVVLLCRQL
jgi:hypothetical protein